MKQILSPIFRLGPQKDLTDGWKTAADGRFKYFMYGGNPFAVHFYTPRAAATARTRMGWHVILRDKDWNVLRNTTQEEMTHEELDIMFEYKNKQAQRNAPRKSQIDFESPIGTGFPTLLRQGNTKEAMAAMMQSVTSSEVDEFEGLMLATAKAAHDTGLDKTVVLDDEPAPSPSIDLLDTGE